VTDTSDKPNLIFYEVLTGKLESGHQIMVQLFRRPDGTIALAQFALRRFSGDSWGIPQRLQFMSSTAAEKDPA